MATGEAYPRPQGRIMLAGYTIDPICGFYGPGCLRAFQAALVREEDW